MHAKVTGIQTRGSIHLTSALILPVLSAVLFFFSASSCLLTCSSCLSACPLCRQRVTIAKEHATSPPTSALLTRISLLDHPSEMLSVSETRAYPHLQGVVICRPKVCGRDMQRLSLLSIAMLLDLAFSCCTSLSSTLSKKGHFASSWSPNGRRSCLPFGGSCPTAEKPEKFKLSSVTTFIDLGHSAPLGAYPWH